jgi:hypothetical protein
MSMAADISEPASELEHLMADLPALRQQAFVFGDDFAVVHLTGAITPVFRGPGGGLFIGMPTPSSHARSLADRSRPCPPRTAPPTGSHAGSHRGRTTSRDSGRP